MPILYCCTGTWTRLVPVKELSIFEYMKPKTNIQELLKIRQQEQHLGLWAHSI
jgi:hypothetical protein